MSIKHRISDVYVGVAVALVLLGILSACATPGQRVSGATPTVSGCLPAGAGATTQDHLAQQACQAVGNLAQSVLTVYDPNADSVKITVGVGGTVPNTDQKVSAAQELTKMIAYQEQQAMWASGVALKQVTVTVMGPTQDEYANIIAQPYGAAVLDAPTAKRLDWMRLSADSAWHAYDIVFLRPYYVLND